MGIQFPPVFLDQLRTRISLSGLIGRKTKLVRAGKLFKGPCPFHNEKTPSFVVYEDKGNYHCFGCGAHGDAITFLTQLEGYTFPEAVRFLADQAGLPLPLDEFSYRDKVPSLPLLECLEAATRWFESQLQGTKGEGARRYLERRKLATDIVRQFRLGYAPNGNLLKDHLLKCGFNLPTLQGAGLVIIPESSNDSYDRFRDRLMFPICNRQGKVIGFGGRILGTGEPKYLNSPETAVFHKGHELYGFHLTRHADLKTSPLIACEGYTDVLAFHQAGFKGAVASLGTALTEHQIELLWRRSAEPVLCFDGDNAGQRAAYKAAERALGILRPGVSLDFVAMPPGDDPASMVEKGETDALQLCLDQKKPLVDLLWEKEIENQVFRTPDQKASLQKKLFSYAAQIKEFSLQSYYKGYFKNKLYELFKTGSQRSNAPLVQRPQINAQERQQEVLLVTVINHPVILDEIFEPFSTIEFMQSGLSHIQEIIINRFNLHLELDYEHLQHHLYHEGYKEIIEKLKDRTHLHAPFSSLKATAEQALKGWSDVWNLYQQRLSQKDENELLRTGFSRQMSSDYWEKIQKIKARQQDNAERDLFEPII